MKSSLVNDFIFSLIGTAVFWTTLAGIAIRRLRIDLDKLNNWLKEKYQDVDATRIDYRNWTRIAVQRTLAAIYGQREETRLVVVVTAAALAMNLFGILVLHRDWQQKRDTIHAIQQESYKIEPRYAALMSTAHGRMEIAQAFAITVDGDPTTGEVAYLYENRDQRSVAIRAITRSYYDKLTSYALNHHLLYDLNLLTLFDHYNVAWVVFLALIISIPSACIDITATIITLSLASALYEHDTPIYQTVLIKGCSLGIVFVLSIFHYANVLAGNVWATGIVLIALVGISSVVVGIFLIMKPEWGFNALTLVLIVGPFVTLYGISDADDRTITQEVTYRALEVWAGTPAISQIHPLTLLLSCTSVFPVLLIISIIVTVALVCLVVYSGKVAVLGEIYGVVAVSGGTYILGVITTIISCTWFVFAVLEMVV